MNEKSVIHGVELRADSAINGLLNAIPAGVTSLTVGTVTYQIADLVAKARQLEKPWKDARAAHATIRAVTQSRPRDYQALVEFLADLKIRSSGSSAGRARSS